MSHCPDCSHDHLPNELYGRAAAADDLYDAAVLALEDLTEHHINYHRVGRVHFDCKAPCPLLTAIDSLVAAIAKADES